jgi:hypothetical protein
MMVILPSGYAFAGDDGTADDRLKVFPSLFGFLLIFFQLGNARTDHHLFFADCLKPLIQPLFQLSKIFETFLLQIEKQIKFDFIFVGRQNVVHPFFLHLTISVNTYFDSLFSFTNERDFSKFNADWFISASTDFFNVFKTFHEK